MTGVMTSAIFYIVDWEYGEIGKHAGFKILCRKASRFKSEYSHQSARLNKTKQKIVYLLWLLIKP